MKIIFENGKISNCSFTDVNRVINELQSKREWIHSIKEEYLIDFLDKASIYWQHNRSLQKKIGPGLKPLCNFLTKKNIKKTLNLALRGNYDVLDNFVKIGDRTIHCQPRGLVVHWLAGNVPILGFYSLVHAILTKNVSLIKASNRAYQELLWLLESFNEINTSHIKGADLLSTIVVILTDHEEVQVLEQMSLNADVRVAWGGEDAVKFVLALKKQYYCEDIIFGPKYSFGIFLKDDISNLDLIAKRIAYDICTFDQYACSSPNVVFVEKDKKLPLIKFATELARALDLVAIKYLPKQDSDPFKDLEILTLRTKYSMLGKAYYSNDTNWTVLVREGFEFPPACHSRVIYVQPLSWEAITKLDRNKQTLGISSSIKKRQGILDKVTRLGIDRVVDFGDMTLFGAPWDGMFCIDRMVRWVSL